MDDHDMDVGDSILSEPVSSYVNSSSELSKNEKIELRRSYRQLIEDTQLNKEDLIKPDCNGLMDKIAKAQELFSKVSETREGALDSKFMSLAVSLGAQKTSLLQTDLIAFQPDEFVQKLVTLMEGSVSPDDPDDVYLPDAGWERLGSTSTSYFTSVVPALHPLSGAFDSTDRQVRIRNVNKNNEENVGRAQLPQHVTNYSIDQKEATPEEIERVLEIIKGFYHHDPTPIDYFELVTNPDSFGHTVENIFHLAFLVKDGLVRVFLNENSIPVVEPIQNLSDNTMNGGKNSDDICNQVMVSISVEEWEEIIKAYQLEGKPPYIPANDSSKRT